MARHAILTLAVGDKDTHATEVTAHEALAAFLKANGSAYGLVSDLLADLDDEQREMLKEAYSQRHVSLTILVIFQVVSNCARSHPLLYFLWCCPAWHRQTCCIHYQIA